jgi:sec-independent protein translocase protein TatA
MGSMSIWHWLVVGAVALLLFGGKGKISELMGDVAKGIKSFKKGMQEEEKVAEAAPPAEPPKPIDQTAATAAQPSATTTAQTQKAG